MSSPDNFKLSDEKIEKNERERIINPLRLNSKLEDLFGRFTDKLDEISNLDTCLNKVSLLLNTLFISERKKNNNFT
jgi:hypothetical protein